MTNFKLSEYCKSRRDEFLRLRSCDWCSSSENLLLKWRLKWWEEPSLYHWNGSNKNLKSHISKTQVICSECVASRKSDVLNILNASEKFHSCQDRDCSSLKVAAKGFCAKHYYHYSKFPEYQKRTLAARGDGTINSEGYRILSIDGKRIAEHRSVMSAHLDRELLPTEEVHHKNGVRTDNRLENLELWAVSQPKGQRVKELLDWAREILSIYEPEEDKL